MPVPVAMTSVQGVKVTGWRLASLSPDRSPTTQRGSSFRPADGLCALHGYRHRVASLW